MGDFQDLLNNKTMGMRLNRAATMLGQDPAFRSMATATQGAQFDFRRQEDDFRKMMEERMRQEQRQREKQMIMGRNREERLGTDIRRFDRAFPPLTSIPGAMY